MLSLRVTLDYETRSRAKLDLCGAIEYAKHPSTSIFCAGYKINDGPEKIWIPELGKMPDDLWHAFHSGILVAHNAGFERAITRWTLPRYVDHGSITEFQALVLEQLPINRWRCTAAKAAASALPRSLEAGAAILGLPTQKDMAGNKLTKKYMKPRKPTKNNPSHWWCDKEDLKRIYAYCKTDVRVEYELDEELPDLSDYEQHIWELDQKINDRGIRIDIPTVKLILKMIDEEMGRVTKRVQKLSRGTIEKGTQRAKVLEWLNDHGAEMENLRAETITEKLLDEDLDPKIRRMLQYRQASSKTSTGKYVSMLHAVGRDHRARELLLYNGTIPTARWSGKRVQPHNFPRPTLPKEMKFKSDEAIELIISGGLPAIREKYGAHHVMDVLVSCVRGMLIASLGCELFCADFAQVEARLAFWVADHEEGMELFRRDAKMYEMMAAEAFDMEVEDVAKDSLERFVGKESVLGCFEADTPVLTERGWVPIINVTNMDRVWDGVEWVSHGGVVYQGKRETIDLAGVKMTPEHQVLTQEGWAKAYQVQSEKHFFLSARGLARLSLETTSWDDAVASSHILYRAHAFLHAVTQSIPIISKLAKLTGAASVETRGVVSTSKSIGGMQTSCLMMQAERACLTGYHLQFKDVITRNQNTLSTMVDEVLKSTGNGELIDVNSYATLSRSTVGTNQSLTLIGAMSTKAMCLAISGLSHTKRIAQIVGQWLGFKKLLPVFDVTNAGIRSRFTILTSEGPLIVHNCQYGMGAPKFMSQCHKKGMRKVTKEIAEKAVYTYRRVHHPIPQLWKNLEEAAINAIQNPGVGYATNKVVFYVKGKWLNIKLPSGRRLRYFKPQLKQKQLRGGRMVPEIRYYGMHEKYWGTLSIWGGVFCNHIVQGIARDLMANGILNIDAAGYDFLLSIHDEGLSERKKGLGNLEKYIKLMTKLPAWANGAPITAEGWKGPRYKK